MAIFSESMTPVSKKAKATRSSDRYEVMAELLRSGSGDRWVNPGVWNQTLHQSQVSTRSVCRNMAGEPSFEIDRHNEESHLSHPSLFTSRELDLCSKQPDLDAVVSLGQLAGMMVRSGYQEPNTSRGNFTQKNKDEL